ncbi:MAG: hypothetical protein V4642_13275 [Bacteroidota bacterium]
MKRRDFLQGMSLVGANALLPNKAKLFTAPTFKKDSLINKVQSICERLYDNGWGELFSHHGLNIRADNLSKELTRDLGNSIDRRIIGFEDFSLKGIRGIEPYRPAESLLYHAFSSPRVTTLPNGSRLSNYPTFSELNIIENYVFGCRPPSLSQLKKQFPNGKFGIVLFASEYRNVPHTPHKIHADLCFSRIGISRAGTREPRYDGESRSFSVIAKEDSHSIRVIPAKFSPYIAVQLKGNRDSFGPMRFQIKDLDRNFWVPIHKIFNGTECLDGLSINVVMRAAHINEKIKRIHLNIQNHQTGIPWDYSDLEQFPFTIRDEIAAFTQEEYGLLVPTPHKILTQPAIYKGKKLTFQVPEGYAALHHPHAASTVFMSEDSGPELIYARHALDNDGEEYDLNQHSGIIEKVNQGNYNAVNYLDYTGDGFVKAEVQGLPDEFEYIAAYSIVAAPSFLPLCNVRELTEWTDQQTSLNHGSKVFPVNPYPLSDSRVAFNYEITDSGFSSRDITGSAIITFPNSGPFRDVPFDINDASKRLSYLPDAATGGFGPGWEVGFDYSAKPPHFALYKLSSPFIEDMKICAAMSSFWPGSVPESSHLLEALPAQINEFLEMQTNLKTVVPFTDVESGVYVAESWDGVSSPRITIQNLDGSEFIEYYRSEYVDYVKNASKSLFNISQVAQITLKDYTERIQSLNRAYACFEKTIRGTIDTTFFIRMLSFSIGISTSELSDVETIVDLRTHRGKIYRFELYCTDKQLHHSSKFDQIRVKILLRSVILVTDENILYQNQNKIWEKYHE